MKPGDLVKTICGRKFGPREVPVFADNGSANSLLGRMKRYDTGVVVATAERSCYVIASNGLVGWVFKGWLELVR